MFFLLVLTSSDVSCSNGNCIDLGSLSSIEFVGKSAFAIGANFGPPFANSCRNAFDMNYVNHIGEFGSGYYQITSEDGESSTKVFCQMPPDPISCKDAKEGKFQNVDGKLTSGTFYIHPSGSAEAYEVYCDMETAGGGWTMVANVRSSGGWMPDTGSGANALSPTFSFNLEGYDPTWSSDITYYHPFENIPYDTFLFQTGFGDYYCAISAASVRNDTNSSDPNASVIASGSSISGTTPLSSGKLVNVFNSRTNPSSPYVGCQGPDGTFANNVNVMMWGESGSQYVEWKNHHGGIGLFIR